MADVSKTAQNGTSDAPSTTGTVEITSEGQRLLRLVDASLSVIGERVGVSRSLVGHWRTGLKSPAPDMRRVLATLYDIPAASWDQRVGGAPERAPAPAPARGEARSSNRAGTDAMLDAILSERGQGGLTVQEFTRLVDAEARVRKLIHDLDQAEQLTETRIVTSPTMQKIRNAAIASLERYPDALRAFLAALESR